MEKEQIAQSRGYFVSELGVLLNKNGIQVGNISSNGRITAKLRHNKRFITFSAHRLQAYQKYEESMYSKGIEVRHFNGDPLDNSWNNILIGTHQQNMMDIPEQVRIKKALHATSFVRKYDKEVVKKFYNNCKSYAKTMKEFNISSKGTLHFIINN